LAAPHPVSLLLQGSAEGQFAGVLFEICSSLFEKRTFLKGTVIWKPDDPSNEIMILEDGELVLSMTDNENEQLIIETILHGTMVGELEFFSQKPRLFFLICEKDSVIWSLSIVAFNKAFQENPIAMRHFI
jgi:CRP-like cAMP-binding protein